MRPRALVLILILAAAGSLFLGRYPSPGFLGPADLRDDPLARELVLRIRLPRIIAAVLLGASLAAAGAVFQMIFSNPLVEPGFLGVSQGAAFGAALCIVGISTNSAAVQAIALAFALAGLGLSWLLARAFRYGGWVLRLVLAGIAVSAFFSAGIGLLKMAADPMRQLPEIVFWLLGGLWSVGWQDVIYLLPPVAAGLAVLWLFRWRIDVLSLDDRVAHSLGSAPGRERAALLFSATLATAAVVSVSGLVGWAGLMIPHAARRIFGASSAKSLPGSMLLGAIYVLLCDDLGRALLPSEIPLGILTSIMGVIVFLALMATRGKGRER